MHKSRSLLALVSLCAALGVTLLATAPANAARDLEWGFVEDQFADNLLTNPNDAIADAWWRRLKQSGADLIRLNMYWSQVAPTQPANPTNHQDPAYDWETYDRAARKAKQHGIEIVFTVFLAPRWAEGPNRPSEEQARIGTWHPNAGAYGNFAVAAASRYSGNFMGLPRVRYWEAWNEPNLPQYLTPQWNGRRPVAPDTYRALSAAFWTGIHAVSNRNKVVAAGTSPFGDRPGGKRMRPYHFWRQVLCLKNRKKLKKARGCASGKQRAHFDIYAHNPINAERGKGPQSKPPHPDDGVPANFNELGRIVRAAERRKTLLPRMKRPRPGWGTETWYESRPPERKAVGLRTQARFMQEAMYVLWRQRARAMFFLQIQDSPYDRSLPPLVGFQTGVYLPNGKPKPSLAAVRFPLVADRRSNRKVLIWGIAPKKGRVTIKDGRRPIKRLRARRSKVFTTRVALRKDTGKHRLRAQMGKMKSLVWVQR